MHHWLRGMDAPVFIFIRLTKLVPAVKFRANPLPLLRPSDRNLIRILLVRDDPAAGTSLPQ